MADRINPLSAVLQVVQRDIETRELTDGVFVRQADVVSAITAALAASQMAEDSAWNFDMNSAPRGKVTTRRQNFGKDKAEREIEVFTPDLIIAAGRCGVVTVSRWLPKAQRWNMFTKDVPPMAWRPFPSAPEARQ